MLYRSKKEMQAAYEKFKPQDKNHYKSLGACCNDTIVTVGGDNKIIRVSGQTSTVFLSLENCEVSVVVHELLHAVLFSHKHSLRKKQYPIVIKNMKEEEVILHNHSYTCYQFYTWYWKVQSQFK